ncbi:MAG TPA: NYN domain-containing protein [Patescibacteria group bacterium]|nr:NYN domain-containing protein [Patescibacteria group bacterium]
MSIIKNKEQRVAVFVDIQNMYYTARHLYQSKVNFGAILKEAVGERKLIRAIAYAVKASMPEEGSFFDALGKSGFEVKTKDLQIFGDGTKKADWDVGLAMDVIKMAPNIDVVILVSGDGDYIPLVEYLQNHGKIVEVVAFGRSSSQNLINRADDFLDLEAISRKILLKFKEARPGNNLRR